MLRLLGKFQTALPPHATLSKRLVLATRMNPSEQRRREASLQAHVARQVNTSSKFIGREDELLEIRHCYEQHMGDGPAIQIISATGGMGKTATVLEYARQHKNDYPNGIYFFFLESKVTFSQSLSENLVAMDIDPSDNTNENFSKLQRYVQQKPYCLFIYDNVDDLNIMKDYIPVSPLHILVTTRRYSINSPHLQLAHKMPLAPLQPHKAINLLLSFCHHHLSAEQLKQDFPSEYEYAQKIVGPNTLNYLPLGIMHAAALANKQRTHETERMKKLWETLDQNRGYLSMEATSLGEWLRNYRLSGILQELEDKLHISNLNDIRKLSHHTVGKSSLTHDEKESLLNARDDLLHCPPVGPWKMDIDSVCFENHHCRLLLQAVSMLPSRDIPVSLLQTILGADNLGFDSALYLLLDRSLLSLSDDKQRLTVHPLIQQSLQQCLVDKNGGRSEVLTSLSRMFLSLFPSIEQVRTDHSLSEDNVVKYSTHLYHVARLILECWKNEFDSGCSAASQKAVDLACALSIQLHNTVAADSLCFLRLSLARRSGIKPLIIQSLIDAGRVKALQHQSSAASTYCQKALALISDGPTACGYKTEQWAFWMIETAEAYWELGAQAPYESIIEKTKDTLETAKETKCYIYAKCLNYLAYCNHVKGNYADAEIASERALSVLGDCVAKDHPTVGTQLASLGFWCIKQRKFVDAEKYLRQSLVVKRKRLPQHHPQIVVSLRKLGELYVSWEKYQKAEECLKEAQDIIDSAYLQEHKETPYVICLMGRCYCGQGKFAEGEKYHRQGVEVRTKMFGHLSRFTAYEYYWLGLSLCGQKKYQEAEDLLRTAIDITKKTLGKHHSRTADAYRELGFCLYKQKKYQASEDALEEAIDITNNLQNEDVRVDRAKTLYNLALCYKATGRLRKMVPILEEAVDIMKGEHGLANNETLKMAGCLREVRKQLRSDL